MEYKNILIIKMSSLGDVLHALPCVAALRRRYPQAKITWLVHSAFADFIPDPPVVDEIIRFERLNYAPASWLKDLRACRDLRRKLHARHYDLVVDLQGLFKSAMVALLSGCRNRVGTAIMREGSALVSPRVLGPHATGHAVDRSLDVAAYLGADGEHVEFPLPDLSSEEARVKTMLAEAGIGNGIGVARPGPYVVMVPATRWATKCWPETHYARLARFLIDAGYPVVLAGGRGDESRSEELLRVYRTLETPGTKANTGSGTSAPLDLTGKTSLRELGALVKSAGLYVSADTGPLHVAAALGVPIVALYGPTRPGRTGPRGTGPIEVVQSDVACAGCLKKRCASMRCMSEITPERIATLCLKALRPEIKGS